MYKKWYGFLLPYTICCCIGAFLLGCAKHKRADDYYDDAIRKNRASYVCYNSGLVIDRMRLEDTDDHFENRLYLGVPNRDQRELERAIIIKKRAKLAQEQARQKAEFAERARQTEEQAKHARQQQELAKQREDQTRRELEETQQAREQQAMQVAEEKQRAQQEQQKKREEEEKRPALGQQTTTEAASAGDSSSSTASDNLAENNVTHSEVQ
jgi:hypothetical protein